MANGEGGWLLAALAPELFGEDSPARLSLLLRGGFVGTLDQPDGDTDQLATELLQLRLGARGEVDRASLFVETQLADGEIDLLDGWGQLQFDDQHRLQVGRFKEPLLRSALVPIANTIFPERTRLGQSRGERDAGALLGALYGPVELTGALQNGGDETAAEMLATVRAQWNALGGGVALDETVIATAPETQLSLGIAFQDEASVAEGETLALDLALRYEGYGAHLEWLSNANGFVEQHPWSATVMGQVLENEADFGLRYEYEDDAASTQVISAAYNHYLAAGFMRFYGAVDWVTAEGDLQDGFRFRIGGQVSL